MNKTIAITIVWKKYGWFILYQSIYKKEKPRLTILAERKTNKFKAQDIENRETKKKWKIVNEGVHQDVRTMLGPGRRTRISWNKPLQNWHKAEQGFRVFYVNRDFIIRRGF